MNNSKVVKEGRNSKSHKDVESVDVVPPEKAPVSKPSSGIDLAAYRCDVSVQEHAGGTKVITTVPVRKPSKECFFRTHPDENARLPTPVIELKDEGATYLVKPDLWPELEGEATFIRKVLVPTITKQGDVFLWPIRLPGPDGTLDDYNESALEIAERARTSWVRMSANRGIGAYEMLIGPEPHTDPTWSLDFQSIVDKAFKKHVIDSMDHPVIRRLKGYA